MYSGSRSSWDVYIKIPLCAPPCGDSSWQNQEEKKVRKEIICVTFFLNHHSSLAAEIVGEVCSEDWRRVERLGKVWPLRSGRRRTSPPASSPGTPSVHWRKERWAKEGNFSMSLLQANDLPVAYLCGQEPYCMIVGDRRALRQAKRNVEQSFPVVGVLEELSKTKVQTQQLHAPPNCRDNSLTYYLLTTSGTSIPLFALILQTQPLPFSSRNCLHSSKEPATFTTNNSKVK